jgi:glycosyltransferase involved in cell wall biosynthesis
VEAAKQFLSKHHLPGEVLVADNGSTDASAEIALQTGAEVISVPERGYGNALRAGLQAAKYPFVIFADCDGSYNFLELQPFYEALAEGADIVIGNRFLGGIEKGAMPWIHRYVGIPVLSWLGRKKCHASIQDFHCGLRGIRKEAILTLGLCTTQMEFASEMIVKAAKNGLILQEVPCRLYKDKRGGKSHLRTVRDGMRHLLFLLHPAWLEK